MNKTVKITIEGISPLLMHRFPMEETGELKNMTPAEQAEIAAYRNPQTGGLYIPGTAVLRALVSAASFTKGKGRMTAQKPAAACLMICGEYLDLGISTFEIDSRPVVIAATKGRVVRHRPRLPKWRVSFDLEYDNDLLSAEHVREIVDNCGRRVGLLDFRPERKGPFGRFVVTNWENL
jgi:hypothetical protein